MTKYLPFILDEQNYMTNQKCFILTGESLAYLTSFLNTKIAHFWIKLNLPELQGGTRELSKIFFENIRIPIIDQKNQLWYVEKVNNIIESKEMGTNTAEIEKTINKNFYELMELTAEEIKFIEAS